MTRANIHLITGGQRSGKSAYAEQLALRANHRPVYLATSKVWDDEYQKRIQLHQEGRTEAWITIEETLTIDALDFPSEVVLLDCITLWLTNVFEHCAYDAIQAQKIAIEQLHKLFKKEVQLFIVSAEIGMGVIPIEASTRRFVDVHGAINQYIAKQATKVSFMVSGLPLTIK